MLNLAQLRKRLQDANLSELSRRTGINVRMLRRIKNGDGNVLSKTLDRLQKAFPK